jgi:hypothetical protein
LIGSRRSELALEMILGDRRALVALRGDHEAASPDRPQAALAHQRAHPVAAHVRPFGPQSLGQASASVGASCVFEHALDLGSGRAGAGPLLGAHTRRVIAGATDA